MQPEQTLVIVKPDGVANNLNGAIIARLEQARFKVIAAKMLKLSLADAEKFYAEHQERSFFPDLVNFMSSGPVLALVLAGENVIAETRFIMGDTDPKKARPWTIRGYYAESIDHNVVHGSDSATSAAREINFFFKPDEIFANS